jgi:hypothetical protein
MAGPADYQGGGPEPGESPRDYERLPGEVRRRIDGYLAHLDRDLPGVVTGLYVVGSLALGDYQPRASDIDLVTVADSTWTEVQLWTAARAHHHVSHHLHPARLAYVTRADLACNPGLSRAACYEGHDHLPSTDLANPLTWEILRSTALAVRGPQHPAAWCDEQTLEKWATEQLHEWHDWLVSMRHRPGSLMFRRSVARPVLEVSRLYEVATTGHVLSKHDAGQAIVSQLPSSRHTKVVADATQYREGHHMSMYWGAMERKHDALDMIAMMTEDEATH